MEISIVAADATDLAVSGNRILSNAAGNQIANGLVLDAGSLNQITTSTTGANLSAADNGNNDLDLGVASAGAFILNSQRNEALDPGSSTAPVEAGPTVVAYLGNEIEPNSITVNVGDGVALGDFTNGSLEVLGNALVATARANDASNQLAIGVTSGGADGGILNSQINSGAVGAVNGFSSITSNLLGDANDTVSVSMEGNQIGSSAIGSNANNALSTAASASFAGTAASGGTVASVGSSAGNVLNNGDIDANGNLALLNSQVSYAPEGSDGIAAATVESSIALNAGGDTVDGSYSLSGNAITANAGANTASNSIAASSGTGGLPSATLVSVQKSTGVTVGAVVGGNSIAGTIGGTGALLGGSASISGNGIGATATINSGTNTIGSAGQSYTRTASF